MITLYVISNGVLSVCCLYTLSRYVLFQLLSPTITPKLTAAASHLGLHLQKQHISLSNCKPGQQSKSAEYARVLVSLNMHNYAA